ncbi:MAG: acyl-CoA dehydrogenase family protein, partial [Myxococcales bacterium]|nr:acyl-CoA dehydrogenase family protein [Myxococcales bacterium]
MATPNYYADNADLQFYVDRWIDWASLMELTEYFGRAPDAFKSTADATAFYKDILTLVGEFAATEIAPHAAEVDRQGVDFADGEATLPPRQATIFDALKQLELHGMCLPRELGGMNVPFTVFLINTELLARAEVSVMAHNGFHGGTAMAMLLFSIREGTTTFDAAARRIAGTRFGKEIEEIRQGKAWGAMDITEPDAGSDMAAIRSVGVQAPDGSWTVSGQKIFITSGNGKYHFVIARTELFSPAGADPRTPEGTGRADDPFAGLGGLSMFLVPAFEDGPSGRRRLATLDRIEDKIGHHGSATCALTFEATPAHLIGKRGEGFQYMLTLMNNARLSVGLESIGLMETALRMAKGYAAERRSMGKTIDRHEMIADYLDEMETDLVGLRAMAMHGAVHEELSQKIHILEASGIAKDEPKAATYLARLKHHRAEARKITPLLKYLAAEKAVEAARRNIQIHGGAGYSTEYGAEKLLRDALVFPIYEGTSQIQALMAMKDTLGGVMKDWKGFLTRSALAHLRSRTESDALERRVAELQRLSYDAQRHLITRTATDKARSLKGTALTSWPKQFTKDWNPKRDFAFAMLHAERLTRLLADVAIAELLL